MKKIALLGLGVLVLSGCSSIAVKPVAVNALQQSNPLCIEDNPKVTVPEFNTYLRDGFKRHNIKTRLLDKGSSFDSCDYKLNYVAYRSWDLAMYLSQIKLELSQGSEVVAEVDWKQGSGAINKWRSSEGKVFDAVDQLVGQPKQIQGSE